MATENNCDAFNHEWVEEYEGHTCKKCGLFVPHGGAPWDEDVFDDDDDDDAFIPCNQCDGHDACRDFGCAFTLGLGKLVRGENPWD